MRAEDRAGNGIAVAAVFFTSLSNCALIPREKELHNGFVIHMAPPFLCPFTYLIAIGAEKVTLIIPQIIRKCKTAGDNGQRSIDKE